MEIVCIEFPVWVMVRKSVFRSKGLLASIVTGGAVGVTDNALFMYKTQIEAEAAIERSKTKGLGPLGINTPAALLKPLKVMVGNGLKDILLGTEDGKHSLQPASEVLDECQRRVAQGSN